MDIHGHVHGKRDGGFPARQPLLTFTQSARPAGRISTPGPFSPDVEDGPVDAHLTSTVVTRISFMPLPHPKPALTISNASKTPREGAHRQYHGPHHIERTYDPEMDGTNGVNESHQLV